MNPHVAPLFEYTRARVTEQHIVDFSPGDPGYPAYVQMWTPILHTPDAVFSNLEEVAPEASGCNAFGVKGLYCVSYPGCAARPWAVEV